MKKVNGDLNKFKEALKIYFLRSRKGEVKGIAYINKICELFHSDMSNIESSGPFEVFFQHDIAALCGGVVDYDGTACLQLFFY